MQKRWRLISLIHERQDPTPLWEMFAQIHNQWFTSLIIHGKIFSHDKTFSSGKVWIALIIHYVQLMVIIYIWPLKLLSLIVHYKRLLRVNVFAIECIQTLRVTLWVQSKQPRTIKTIIYNDIFTSLGRKNVLSPAKQFK